MSITTFATARLAARSPRAVDEDAGYTVSPESDRDTSETQIAVADGQTTSVLVFLVPGANAGDAFRYPFRYAP